MNPSLLSPQAAVLSLAIGIICALAFYLRTRLSPGGLLTPGWLAAAAIWEPRAALVVLGASVLTFLGILIARRYMILYGDRLLAASMLLGIVLVVTGYLATGGAGSGLQPLYSFAALGLIVPGWSTYQLTRQPVLPTLITTALATAVTGAVLGAVVVIS
jgi:poly-gamma-glutamate biosynthesis protein PgsC/CapC